MIVTALDWPRPRRRRARRWLWRSVRLGIVLGGIVLSLGAAYEAGRSQADTESVRLLGDLDSQRTLNRQLDAKLADAQQREIEASRAAAARTPASDPLQPTPIAGLMALVRGKLAEGVEPARLGAAIAGVTRDRHCDPAIEAHRIILKTPVSQDATRAAFAGGLFTVSGQGISVRDAAGLPEAWFDPAQPVQLEIRMSDGTSVSASGVLPLSHALVRAQHRYDLTARADRRRGMVALSVEVCAYP
jgi:hypothetical protein